MTLGERSAVNYEKLIKNDRVHGRLYYDPEIFREEMDKIWHRGWVYVGHESEVAEPGEYVTRRLGLQPIIIVRDQERKVNLFMNRCRHRGNTVCQHERGQSSFLRCEYHGWTYGTKGDLVVVPFADGYDGGFRKEDYGLTVVPRVDSYRGFIFASLSSTGISLDEHMGGAKEYIDMFLDLSPEGEVELRAGLQKARYRGNWKMMAENSVEGTYHAHFLHKFHFDLIKARAGVDASDPKRAQVWGHIRCLPEGHMVEDFRPGKRAPGVLARIEKFPPGVWERYVKAMEKKYGKESAHRIIADDSQFIFIFPNMILLQTHIRRLQPVNVNETYLYYQPALLKGVPPEINVARLREHEYGFGPAGFLSADDLEILERNQLGIEARADEWLLLGRGIHREEIDERGGCVGHGTDEGHLRVMWRHYKGVMLQG